MSDATTEQLRADADRLSRERDEARGRCMEANATGNDWRERAERAEAAAAQMREVLTAHCCREFGPPVRSSVSDSWIHTATPTGRLVCSSHPVILATDAGREMGERLARYEGGLREISSMPHANGCVPEGDRDYACPRCTASRALADKPEGG